MIVKSRLNWLPYKLGDIAEVVTGSTPSSERSELYGNDVPFVTPADLDSREIIIKTKRGLSKLGAIEARILPPETILVCCIGATIGKVGFGGTTLATNQQINSLVINQDLAFPKFVYHYCRTIKPIILANSTSTTLPIINKSRFSELPIFLPPFPEQKRIADILDKADAIRRKRQEAIRLTDELLRSVFLDMFGDIPARKSKHTFGTIRSYVVANSGKSSKDVLSKETTSIPIYGGNGRNGWAIKALYDEPVVVVGRVGQQCGITHLTSGPCWVTDNAIVVRVTDKTKLHPIYLSVALQNSPLRTTVERFDLPFINQSIILDYEIPLPPVDLQIEYAKIQEQAKKSRDQLTSSSDSSDELFNSLVQRAFRGEL